MNQEVGDCLGHGSYAEVVDGDLEVDCCAKAHSVELESHQNLNKNTSGSCTGMMSSTFFTFQKYSIYFFDIFIFIFFKRCFKTNKPKQGIKSTFANFGRYLSLCSCVPL